MPENQHRLTQISAGASKSAAKQSVQRWEENVGMKGCLVRHPAQQLSTIIKGMPNCCLCIASRIGPFGR